MPDPRHTLFDRLAVIGKAFASAKRLELIDLLSQGERSVDALAAEAGLGVSTVSAHLQVLKLANLVSTRRDGTRIHYRLAGDDVAAVYSALRSVAQEHSADVERALAAYLGIGVHDPDPVEQITRAELLDRLERDEVLLVDVRPAPEYHAAHIPGAVSLPFDVVAERLAEIPADVEVVAYCRGGWCVLAHDAVRLLRAEGRRARRLQDGMLEWRVAGLPVQEAGTP
ncbi:MAG: ArsR/SmtB family transcription factor [Actinomycetes bacterium]